MVSLQSKHDYHMSDLPLATPSQFRAAVRQVVGQCNIPYTDKLKAERLLDTGLRHVAAIDWSEKSNMCEAIEFVLWSQGVTARTRKTSGYIRGTCMMSREAANG